MSSAGFGFSHRAGTQLLLNATDMHKRLILKENMDTLLASQDKVDLEHLVGRALQAQTLIDLLGLAVAILYIQAQPADPGRCSC